MNNTNHTVYQEVFEASLDAIVCSNETGLITLWNRAAEQMFGFSVVEAVGRPLTMLMGIADKKKHQAGFHRFISTGKARILGQTVEVNALGKDGISFPVELSLSSEKTVHGRNFIAILRNISKRKKTMHRLKRYEHQQTLSNKLSMDALSGVDLDTLFQSTTEAIAKALGVEYCKVLELEPDGKLLFLRAGVGWASGLVGHARIGIELESQAGYTLKSNHPVVVNDFSTETRFSGPSLLRDHAVVSGISVIIGGIDQPWGVLGCHSTEHRDFSDDDINFIQTLAIERKLADEALRILVASLVGRTGQDFFDNLVVQLAQWLNVECVILGELVAEDRVCKLAMVLDKELVPDFSYALTGAPCGEVANKGFRFYSEGIRTLFPNDDELQAMGAESYVGTPLRDIHGKSMGIICAISRSKLVLPARAQDMFEIIASKTAVEIQRIQTENALLQEKAQFQSLYSMLRLMCDNMPDMIWAKGIDKRYIFANKALCDKLLHARNTDEPVGKLDMFFTERERNMHPDDSQWHTFGEICRDSDSITLESGKAEQFDEFGNVRRKFLFLDVRKAPMLDENGDVIGVVGSARDVTDIKHAEAQLRKLSQAIEQAGESILITNRQGIIEYVNPAFTKMTGYSADEAIGQNPRLLNSGNQDGVFYANMWNTIMAGDVWHGKVTDRKKNGSFFPAMLTISPIVEEAGDSTHCSHFVGIQSDLTEIEDLEQQFHQAQKMEAIGTLVGGIAHDFNNMLAGMTGNLYLAKLQTRDMPGVVKKLNNIEQIALRASNMIGQLLTFARKGRVSIKAIPFNAFINETCKLLRPSVPENIAMYVDVCSDLLQVNGDATQLHQVLMNLINNARDAIEEVDDPCITVRLEAFYADDAFVESRANLKTGVFAHVSVSDNGCGIPEDQSKHLFEPFFTTKEQGKGTGLGLAMVFGAVKTHHGFVEVDSIEGEGATFHIYIPLLEPEDIVAQSEHAGQPEEAGHGETILLVDDEQCIVETGQEVLESLGYRVLVASNGQQAVEMFEAHSEDIDLCIFDIVMPVMGGDKAAEYIRRIRPEIKIIFSTGYDKNLQSSLVNETVLNKPFSIVEMSQMIRQQLSE
jgi:PAS domain S-box-containing protein